MSLFRSSPHPPLLPVHRRQDVDLHPSNTTQHDELDLDAGFEMSPFGGPVINLQFRSGFPLTIHRTFLLRSSKLALLCDATTKILNLRHISAGAGHILVQYFYTNRYEALEWTGTPRPDAGVVRFKIAVEVYAAAREYGLDGLEELAKEQIEYDGSGLHAFTVIDAVRETYPTPTQDDFWFPEYMKSRIKTAFEDPASLMSAPFQIDFIEPMSIAKVVFRSMLEVYCEMLESLTRGATIATGPPADPLTPPTEVSFNDTTTSLPVVEPPEWVEDSFDEPAGLTTDEPEERPRAGTETNTIIQTEAITDEELPAEENTVPFSFEDHQADPEVALGFRYHFSGKGIDHELDVSDRGPSFGESNKPLQKQPGDFQVDLSQEPDTRSQYVREKDSFPIEISHKQEFDSQPRATPEYSPTVEPNRQSLESPLRGVTPDRASSGSTPDRTTPSPPKEGDEFWASLSRRRKERMGKGRRATVSFDLPESGPPQGESSKKGKEPMGTTPQSVTGLGPSFIAPELTSIPYQRQNPPPPLTESMHGDGELHHSLFDPGDLSKQEVKALTEEPGLGAELEREQNTPEPTGGDEEWDTWGIHLSTTRKRRKRAMSLSQDALMQVDNELGEPQTATHDTVPPTTSQESTGPAHGNLKLDLHVVTGGVDIMSHEPEPMSGALILAQDDTDIWDRTASPSIPSDVPQGQSIPKKKRSKRSKKLKALVEEHGASLKESATEQIEPADVGGFPEEKYKQNVEVQVGGIDKALPRSQSQPEAENLGEEPDPWKFWGATRSPSLRKSF